VTKDKWSALHYAAHNGHTSIIDALVQARADVNAVNVGGETPLDYAKGYGYTEVARLLEAAGGRGKR
jgi:ankyrin repeat protein